MTKIFGLLRTRGTQLILIGLVLAAVMYLIGPGRGPTWLRGRSAAGLRATGRGMRTGSHSLRESGPGWAAGHLDALRVGGVVVAAGVALLLSSWLSLIVVAL